MWYLLYRSQKNYVKLQTLFLKSTGLVSGGNFNSKEGCQPYSIEDCISFCFCCVFRTDSLQFCSVFVCTFQNDFLLFLSVFYMSFWSFFCISLMFLFVSSSFDNYTPSLSYRYPLLYLKHLVTLIIQNI